MNIVQKYYKVVIATVGLLCVIGLFFTKIYNTETINTNTVIDVPNSIVIAIKDQINDMLVINPRDFVNNMQDQFTEFLNNKPNISIPNIDPIVIQNMKDQIKELNKVIIQPIVFNMHNMHDKLIEFVDKNNFTTSLVDPIAVAHDMKDQIMELVNYSNPIVQDVNNNIVGFFNFAVPIAQNFIKKIEFNSFKLNPNIFKEHF